MIFYGRILRRRSFFYRFFVREHDISNSWFFFANQNVRVKRYDVITDDSKVSYFPVNINGFVDCILPSDIVHTRKAWKYFSNIYFIFLLRTGITLT